MRIYEYGKQNPECILLIHPSLVTWDYFENVVPLLENDYHLLIPAVPGYDLEDRSQFSSVEEIASELADELLQRGVREVKTIYGCSMGGSIVLRMAADGKLKGQNYVMDGGITPYQLPWILTRFIALRDFGMMALGKLGGESVIVKAFSSTQYSEEDLKYVSNIFRHCTYKTLWNTFDSCNPGTERPKGLHRYFESFRAYATSLDEVEQFDIWCQKNNIPVKTRSKDIASIKNIDKSLSTIIHVISATTGTGFFAFMISTLHASIRRKWKMLGMLRLIGFSRLSILIYPMTQAITTGLFGILLSFLIYGIIAFGIDMLFASQSGGEAICVVHTVDFCIIAVIVQLLIIISSWKISLQASRIDPSLAIRES